MAFDLNTSLQVNKRFLAGAFLAAGVFFTAGAVIDSFLGGDLTVSRNEVAAARSKMTNSQLYTAKNLDEARTRSKALDESVSGLADRLRFKPRPQYQLKEGGASPANQYIGIAAELRERRLDDARSRAIDIVDHVGIPDRSPTEVDEISRTLRCLDLIDQVLGLVLLPGTRSVDRIVIASDRKESSQSDRLLRESLRIEFEMNLTSQALSKFIEASQGLTPPITIESLDATTLGTAQSGRGDGLVRVLLTVAALDIAPPKE